jgi:hypothetical protein
MNYPVGQLRDNRHEDVHHYTKHSIWLTLLEERSCRSMLSLLNKFDSHLLNSRLQQSFAFGRIPRELQQ